MISPQNIFDNRTTSSNNDLRWSKNENEEEWKEVGWPLIPNEYYNMIYTYINHIYISLGIWVGKLIALSAYFY